MSSKKETRTYKGRGSGQGDGKKEHIHPSTMERHSLPSTPLVKPDAEGHI